VQWLVWIELLTFILLEAERTNRRPSELKSDNTDFLLGITLKEEGKYDESLKCLHRTLKQLPATLTSPNVWYEIGQVYELKKDVRSLSPP
jgi:tetratricopeptide (TPR) repeat protein